MTARLPAVAVIADAHVHDIHGDYDFDGISIDGERLILRSWKDTRRSSRTFNESKAAFVTALEDIHRRGIRHVVLLGDYTDDGQIEASTRIRDLLERHAAELDLEFYVIPGNHDFYGPMGKHQSTRFASAAGKSVLVTSDPEVARTESNSSVLTRKMYCEGTPAALLPLARYGLFKQAHYRHWETPFGQDDAIESRSCTVRSADGQVSRKLMDASYLVEPADGLWLLMIDANVFAPRNGQWKLSQKKAFHDSSNAGWNAVLQHKGFLIDWIQNVCERASQLDKCVLAFSHYPILDAFRDHGQNEFNLFGSSEVVRRTPDPAVAEALSATGLKIHFGGHMHVNAHTRSVSASGAISDIAVPSLAAYPAAYKVLNPSVNSCRVDHMPIESMPLDERLMRFYRTENRVAGDEQDASLSAENYGAFQYQRMRSRLRHRYLQKDWPAEIAIQLDGADLLDLLRLLSVSLDTKALDSQASDFKLGEVPIDSRTDTRLNAMAVAHQTSLEAMQEVSMLEFIADWYCLRQGGTAAPTDIGKKKMAMYQLLASEFGQATGVTTCATIEFFYRFIDVLKLSLQRAAQTDPRSETVAFT